MRGELGSLLFSFPGQVNPAIRVVIKSSHYIDKQPAIFRYSPQHAHELLLVWCLIADSVTRCKESSKVDQFSPQSVPLLHLYLLHGCLWFKESFFDVLVGSRHRSC